jgi:hypothetical protein
MIPVKGERNESGMRLADCLPNDSRRWLNRLGPN